MPTKIFIFKKEILTLFDFVQNKLLSPKYYALNEVNKVVKYDIVERLQQAEKSLSLFASDEFFIYNGVEPPEIAVLF